MKPFDLEAALKGELVVLREGKIAQVMCDLNNNKLPQANSTFFHQILTIGEDLCIYLHKKNGESWLGYNNKDIIGMYEKTHPLRDAKVDDPVMVRAGVEVAEQAVIKAIEEKTKRPINTAPRNGYGGFENLESDYIGEYWLAINEVKDDDRGSSY